MCDGVVKTLHPESRRLAYLLRHCKLNVITTYLSTPHSIKFAFLEYEVLDVYAYRVFALTYLAIQKFTFYEFVTVYRGFKKLYTTMWC